MKLREDLKNWKESVDKINIKIAEIEAKNKEQTNKLNDILQEIKSLTSLTNDITKKVVMFIRTQIGE